MIETGRDQMEPVHCIMTDAILEEAERLVGPASKWAGRCYEIACALVKHGLVTGEPLYGHYLGPIAEGSQFGARRGHGFVQHGWVLAPDGKIIDPTRWVFEAVDPYIYMGPNKGLYDEGGNTVRLALEQPCPGYLPPTDPQDFPTIYDVDLSPLSDAAKGHLLALMREPPGVNNRMVFWVANLAPERLGEHLDEVYEFLCNRDDFEVAIPMDNRRAWERERNGQRTAQG